MSSIGIRRDVFTSEQQGRMSDEQLVAIVKREDLGTVRKMRELTFQARAALADGDIETAAYIETLKVSIDTRR